MERLSFLFSSLYDFDQCPSVENTLLQRTDGMSANTCILVDRSHCQPQHTPIASQQIYTTNVVLWKLICIHTVELMPISSLLKIRQGSWQWLKRNIWAVSTILTGRKRWNTWSCRNTGKTNNTVIRTGSTWEISGTWTRSNFKRVHSSSILVHTPLETVTCCSLQYGPFWFWWLEGHPCHCGWNHCRGSGPANTFSNSQDSSFPSGQTSAYTSW